MVNDSSPGRKCDKLYSSTLKWFTIEPADTVPIAILARQRLRQKKSLNGVSTVGGQDQGANTLGKPLVKAAKKKPICP